MHHRLVIKKVIGASYTHSVYIVGATSTPIAHVTKKTYGCVLTDLENRYLGTYDSHERVKMAVVEKGLLR